MTAGSGHQPGKREAKRRQTAQVFGEVSRQRKSGRDHPVTGQLPDLVEQTFGQTVNDHVEAVMVLLDLQGYRRLWGHFWMGSEQRTQVLHKPPVAFGPGNVGKRTRLPFDHVAAHHNGFRVRFGEGRRNVVGQHSRAVETDVCGHALRVRMVGHLLDQDALKAQCPGLQQ
ncbi:hypothetical protein OKW12_001993 [Pseudomonas silensiensis]|nr:hypothetical protein [Pseudomonas silensiensis]